MHEKTYIERLWDSKIMLMPHDILLFALCSKFSFLKFIIFLQHMQSIPQKNMNIKIGLDDKSHFIPPNVAWRNDRKYVLCTCMNSKWSCTVSFDCFLSAAEFGRRRENILKITFSAQMLLRKINWKMLLQASGKYEFIYFQSKSAIRLLQKLSIFYDSSTMHAICSNSCNRCSLFGICICICMENRQQDWTKRTPNRLLRVPLSIALKSSCW